MTDADACVRRLHEAVQDATPLIQCITNTVVQQYTANVLLASGASPAMMDHEADAAEFAAVASALLVNFGTPTSHQYLAAQAAVDAMDAQGKPWVLDPVGIGAAAFRTAKIRWMIAAGPTAIRGNASEIIAAAGREGSARGTDAAHAVDAAIDAAGDLARERGTVAAISGPADAIVFADGKRTNVITVRGGSRFMPLVIGTGCALGALTAAYLSAARTTDVLRESSLSVRDGLAVAAAHVHFKAAGAFAEASASGPGTFGTAFLDALYAVDADRLAAVEVAWSAGDEE